MNAFVICVGRPFTDRRYIANKHRSVFDFFKDFDCEVWTSLEPLAVMVEVYRSFLERLVWLLDVLFLVDLRWIIPTRRG